MLTYDPPVACRFWGDWDDAEEEPKRYEGLLGGRWNGWAVPIVTREVLDVLVADHSDQLAWEEAGMLRVAGQEGGGEEQWIIPDDEGLYRLDFGWCWDAETAGPDPARISPGQRASYERLRGSMRFSPHDLTVLAGGAHVVPVLANLGRRDGVGVCLDVVARVRFEKDGAVSVLGPEAATS